MIDFIKFSILGLCLLTIISCGDEEKSSYELASSLNGGRLYNTFWDVESGFNQSDTARINKIKRHADFFKCKQCHGWDQMGTEASYIGRAPSKTRPRVGISLIAKIQSYSPDQLFSAIKTGPAAGFRRSFSTDLTTYDPSTNFTEGDKMPNYSEILTDAQIWDLVKFLKEGRFDVNQLYDFTTTGAYPSGKISYSNLGKGGDDARGKALFVSKGCNASSCHGANGTAQLVDNKTFTIGGFMKAKPNEAQHKIQYGQLENSGMPAAQLSLQQMKDIYKALSDTIAFPLK